MQFQTGASTTTPPVAPCHLAAPVASCISCLDSASKALPRTQGHCYPGSGLYSCQVSNHLFCGSKTLSLCLFFAFSGQLQSCWISSAAWTIITRISHYHNLPAVCQWHWTKSLMCSPQAWFSCTAHCPSFQHPTPHAFSGASIDTILLLPAIVRAQLSLLVLCLWLIYSKWWSRVLLLLLLLIRQLVNKYIKCN